MDDDDRPAGRPFAFGLFEHAQLPILTVVFIAVGVGAGLYVLPSDWSLLMRLGAGFALGMAAVLSLFANRMIGGKDFD